MLPLISTAVCGLSHLPAGTVQSTDLVGQLTVRIRPHTHHWGFIRVSHSCLTAFDKYLEGRGELDNSIQLRKQRNQGKKEES